MRARIEEKDGKLYVTAATTLTYGKRFHTYKNWTTSDVIQYIKEHHPQYSITSVIKGKDTFISNYRRKYLRGEWVFALAPPDVKREPVEQPPPTSEGIPLKPAPVVENMRKKPPLTREEYMKKKGLRRRKKRPIPQSPKEDK